MQNCQCKKTEFNALVLIASLCKLESVPVRLLLCNWSLKMMICRPSNWPNIFLQHFSRFIRGLQNEKTFGVKLLNSKGIPHTERMEKIWERFIHLSRLIIMHGLTFASLRFTHHVWIPQLQVIICQCAKHEWMSFLYRIPKTEPYFLFCGLELYLFLCLQHLVLAPNFSWPPHFLNFHLLMDRINVIIPLLRGAQNYPA